MVVNSVVGAAMVGTQPGAENPPRAHSFHSCGELPAQKPERDAFSA
jgi:hypothetical protein